MSLQSVSKRGLGFFPRSFAVAATLLCALAGCRETVPVAPDAKTTRPNKSDRQQPRKLASAGQDQKDGGGPAAASNIPTPRTPVEPQRLYRDPDDRPRHDDRALAAVGIQKYESRRLLLYTDIDADEARPLPALMDAAYAAWEEYFGPLPPDRDGAVFQMTGYLMRDQAPFRETGLLPETLPPFPHGRNRGRRFWMNDQTEDYYRRHLLLHEGTHCFMAVAPNPFGRVPWYMEGMAELFGTHSIDTAGRPHFRVLPDQREHFAGLGRIRLVNDDVREGRLRTVAEVTGFRPNDFLENAAYAWSWALCEFLDSHPRYREKFRAINQNVVAGGSSSFDELFASGQDDLDEAWLLFAANLCHGYDVERATIEFREGRALAGGMSAQVEIASDRGWQSTGVRVEQGRSYRVTAKGRFVIAQGRGEEASGGELSAKGDVTEEEKRPRRAWECEPQGISFRYHDGRPLGMLVGTIRAQPRPAAAPHTTMLDIIAIGREASFVASETGTLYLRVNDYWNELADNAGRIEVQIVSQSENQ